MDALIDTVKMLPFLYLACLAIEAIEHSHGDRIEQALAGGGRWGCAAGAVLGCIPQCGFSAMAANLYGGRVITLGTLMAVFLATSDEAIPLLVALPGASISTGRPSTAPAAHSSLPLILCSFFPCKDHTSIP